MSRRPLTIRKRSFRRATKQPNTCLRTDPGGRMGMSGRWLCTALLIGCASKGPTDRPAHPPPDTPGPSGTTTPATPEETPEELIQELEDEYFIPKLDRTPTLEGIDLDKN